MFYCRLLLLLAATAAVFGYSVRRSPQLGIAGGEPVPISEVPFMAQLRTKDGGHLCGGSIVHELFVLTAAHCCYYRTVPAIHKVAIGTDRVLSGDTYDVEKIIYDERFSFEKGDYDVCLLKLTEELSFGPNVSKVELANEDFELKAGMEFNATGWGLTQPYSNETDLLLEVSLPFVELSECAKYYEEEGNLTDSMFCAGIKGKGVCSGDSGGPLTWHNVQVGIASRSILCNEYPGVFIKISAMLSWITDTIANNI